MAVTTSIVTQTIATLIGIFVGTLAALVIDRRNEGRQLRRRAKIVLRSLEQELTENYNRIKTAKPAYTSTPWGQSFFISTIAWETAMAGGDLPDIIGFELTDSIATQYASFSRIRYYVDLLTQLWFAPSDVSGYEEMRRGFNRAILQTMSQVTARHPSVKGQIEQALKPH